MAEIVNLNRARKVRRREDAEAVSAANRARHGRTRAERLRDEEEAARRARTLDQARIERD